MDPHIIQTWNINGYEVKLLNDNDHLKYETVDTQDGRIVYPATTTDDNSVRPNLLFSNSSSTDERIAFLKNSRIKLGEKGNVFFLQNLKTWDLDHYSVYLIRGANELIWEVFCKSLKNTTFHSLLESTIPSVRCHPETATLIEEIKNKSFTDRESRDILKHDFQVVRVWDLVSQKEYNETLNSEVNKNKNFEKALAAFLGTAICGVPAVDFIRTGLSAPSITHEGITVFGSSHPVILCACVVFISSISSFLKDREKEIKEKIIIFPQKPLLIEIEPRITAPSLIDSRIIVSKFTWAVTLVSHEGPSNETLYGNHAKIYIEGINDGYYDKKPSFIRGDIPLGEEEKFLHLAHVLPLIESRLISPDELEYETRTQIWMISSDKVQKMLNNIELEMSRSKNVRPFNRYGKDSYIKGKNGLDGHNCFTWARDHLNTIGINLEKEIPSLSGLVTKLVTDYTKLPSSFRKTPIQRI